MFPYRNRTRQSFGGEVGPGKDMKRSQWDHFVGD